MSSHEIAEADANLREIVRLRAELTQARRWARVWKAAAHHERMWANILQRHHYADRKRLAEFRRELAVEKAKRTLLARVLRKKVLK